MRGKCDDTGSSAAPDRDPGIIKRAFIEEATQMHILIFQLRLFLVKMLKIRLIAISTCLNALNSSINIDSFGLIICSFFFSPKQKLLRFPEFHI